MIPLYDESFSTHKFPIITVALISLNVIVYFFVLLIYLPDYILDNFAATPASFLSGENWKSLITSMFIHGDILHLIGNMWFLWIFGDNIEHNLGRVRFLLLYFGAGIFATLIHGITTTEPFIPLIGASGAISGVLGAYLILYPKNRIRAFMIVYFRPYTFYVPAYAYLFVWMILQLFYSANPSSIAYTAHIAGFIFGGFAGLLMGSEEEKIHFTVIDDKISFQRKSSGWEQD